MAKTEFKVIGEMVYLQFQDQTGATVQAPFYRGAVVFREDDDEENTIGSITEKSIEHHIETGQLVPVDDDIADVVGPAGTPLPGDEPQGEKGPLPTEPKARTRRVREAVTGKSVEDQEAEERKEQEKREE